MRLQRRAALPRPHVPTPDPTSPPDRPTGPRRRRRALALTTAFGALLSLGLASQATAGIGTVAVPDGTAPAAASATAPAAVPAP